MLLKSNLFLSFVFFVCNAKTSKAVQSCIANFTQLVALQEARGNNVTTPATYIMCPNTVYVPTDFEKFELNGNAKYLCGASGSSANSCIVRGGSVQLSVAMYAYNFADKDNILISGFTFEKAELVNAVVAISGRMTFQDCIFKVREQECDGWYIALL
jgi:hypothetical protein